MKLLSPVLQAGPQLFSGGSVPQETPDLRKREAQFFQGKDAVDLWKLMRPVMPVAVAAVHICRPQQTLLVVELQEPLADACDA